MIEAGAVTEETMTGTVKEAIEIDTEEVVSDIEEEVMEKIEHRLWKIDNGG